MVFNIRNKWLILSRLILHLNDAYWEVIVEGPKGVKWELGIASGNGW